MHQAHVGVRDLMTKCVVMSHSLSSLQRHISKVGPLISSVHCMSTNLVEMLEFLFNNIFVGFEVFVPTDQRNTYLYKLCDILILADLLIRMREERSLILQFKCLV